MRYIPSNGDVYSNKRSGEVYTVITVANMDATRPGWEPTVVYEDSMERVWSRPLAYFINRFDPVAPEEQNP